MRLWSLGLGLGLTPSAKSTSTTYRLWVLMGELPSSPKHVAMSGPPFPAQNILGLPVSRGSDVVRTLPLPHSVHATEGPTGLGVDVWGRCWSPVPREKAAPRMERTPVPHGSLTLPSLLIQRNMGVGDGAWRRLLQHLMCSLLHSTRVK